jgi:hypothetical protein
MVMVTQWEDPVDPQLLACESWCMMTVHRAMPFNGVGLEEGYTGRAIQSKLISVRIPSTFMKSD